MCDTFCLHISIPSNVYRASSLCSESSIVSFYKHISKTGKKKFESVFQPLALPLCFLFFQRERGVRTKRQRRLVWILSLCCGRWHWRDTLCPGMAFRTGNLSYIAVVFQPRIGPTFPSFWWLDHVLLEPERNPRQPQFPDLNKEVVKLDKL